MTIKYICNSCGVEIELKVGTQICPICKHGHLIYKSVYKTQDELAEMVGENLDEDLTPKQDADEQIEEYFMAQMAEAMARHGNDKMWDLIEKTTASPEARLKYRKYFFAVGGICPEGEAIRI